MKAVFTFKAPEGTRRKDTVIETDLAPTANFAETTEAVRHLMIAETAVNKLCPAARFTITFKDGSVSNG